MDLSLSMVGESPEDLLNKRPLNPIQLAKEIDSSQWLGKANAFHLLRGTEPSVGYFLYHGSDLPVGEVNVDITSLEGEPIVIKKLQVEEAVAVSPGYEKDKPVFMVKVIDPIVQKLEYTYTDKNYNIPTGASSQGTIYDKTTLRSANTPYNWKTLLEDLLPNIETKNAKLPSSKPEGFLFRGRSIKSCIDELSSLLAHTLVRSKEGDLDFIPINPVEAAITSNDLIKNNLAFRKHRQVSDLLSLLPEKIEFRFPKAKLGNNLSVFYEKITKTVSTSLNPVKDTTWVVQAPLFATDTNGSQRTELADELLANYTKAWGGRRTDSLAEQTLLGHIDISTDEKFSSVTWMLLDSGGPRTVLSSSPGKGFPDRSKEYIPRFVHGVGVATAVSGSKFSIKDILLYAGELEEVASGNTEIEDVKKIFGGQEIKDDDKVVFFRNLSTGEIEAFKPGGEATVSLDRFEMVEDLTPGDPDEVIVPEPTETFAKARILITLDWWQEVASELERFQMEFQEPDDDSFTTGSVKTGEIVKQRSPEGFYRFTGVSDSHIDNSDFWERETELGEEIIAVDKDKYITAYGPYLDCAGNGQEAIDADPEADPPVEHEPGTGGFRGTGFKFTDNYDNTEIPGYFIITIETLVPMVLVELVKTEAEGIVPKYLKREEAGESSGETFVSAVGSNEQNRLPKQEIFVHGGSSDDGSPEPDVEGVANVSDDHKFIEESKGGEKWLIGIVPRTDKYTYLVELQKKEGTVTVIVSGDILPASGSLASFIAGEGLGKKTEVDGVTYTAIDEDIPIHNFSETTIRASEDEPIRLTGTLSDGILLVGGSVMDNRSVPGFDRAKRQYMIHVAIDGAFELIEECELDVVTSVQVNEEGNALTYTKHPFDSCEESDVKVIDLGPCDTGA